MTLPGLSTSTSEFSEHYLRNTYAYIKEVAALRAEAFRRVVWDRAGQPATDQDRVAILPLTLVFVSDTGAVPTAPAWLQRAGLGADVMGTGATQRGSEGGV